MRCHWQGNNTCLVPPSFPETVNCILNYSASSEATDGATRFVAEDGLCSLCPEPGAAPTRPPQLNDPPEELYARERAVRYTAVRPAGIWVAFFQECRTY